MMKVNRIFSLRGMKDVIPAESFLWQKTERVVQRVLESFGYQEIRFPILEKTELFSRTIGVETDIVNKEMYTFMDRHAESVSLRPEGTASCVRSGIEQGLFYKKIQRLWYYGPFFRYERPQKGRLRQFHQYGAEAFGFSGPDIDAEMIMITAKIFEALQLTSSVVLQLNSLGTPEMRTHYRYALQSYFLKHQSKLDSEHLARLQVNPLRMLDSKDPFLQDLLVEAPLLWDYLDESAKLYFQTLQHYLKTIGIVFRINPYLVRGLDYYTHTVFEWVTDQLGAQSAVCSGGRYDGLVAQLGGHTTPAVGFGLGMERLLLLMQKMEIQLESKQERAPHIYFITDGESAFIQALHMTQNLRRDLPRLRLILHCGGGTLTQQIKKADQSGAMYACILGEKELKEQVVSCKALRQAVPQCAILQDALCDYLRRIIENEC